ncbi:restriction endonuclease [Gimesia chilikensis]|uniref:C2H2-type domain-containing protein n=1 Tax=Gimesia chilikensis TaxID=2605989 RepID=A0A517PVX3_9PLAN|nr:restriction endonuclease [Gimesia chilikensis]QDT23524.1 hypothetical protein HG66A1_53450 [Gimesia chilikensis]
MIDYTEIDFRTDGWEQFARDFLVTRGFFIESTVDRGPDHGKDLLVTENLKGNLSSYQFRWLVSCKHNATSGKSVSEDDEPNILERLKHFKADGFIGFYSTLASSGLNSRLQALRENKEIKDYSIFDGRLIENLLMTTGYSPLMLQYFPNSYKNIRPLHLILDEYQPLKCKVCGKDLLMELYLKEHVGNLVHAKVGSEFHEAYVVCKVECDEVAEKQQHALERITQWADLDDLVMPIEFLRHIFTMVNRIRSGQDRYTDEAFDQAKNILISLAQRVLRHTTAEERQRFVELSQIPF